MINTKTILYSFRLVIISLNKLAAATITNAFLLWWNVLNVISCAAV